MIAVFSLKLHHLTNLTHPVLSSKCSSDNESFLKKKQLVSSTHKGSTKNCTCQWGRDLFLGFYATGFQVLELFLQNGFFRQTKYNPLIFLFPGHFKKKKDLISNNEVLSDPNKQNRTQKWTKTRSRHYQFFKERRGETWTNPDRLDADKLHQSRPSFVSPDKREESGTHVQL